jgi:hypothetical protein
MKEVSTVHSMFTSDFLLSAGTLMGKRFYESQEHELIDLATDDLRAMLSSYLAQAFMERKAVLDTQSKCKMFGASFVYGYKQQQKERTQENGNASRG